MPVGLLLIGLLASVVGERGECYPMNDKAVVEARYPGVCRGCSEAISVGQPVVKSLYVWVHRDCEAAWLQTVASGPRERTAVGYEVQCPKCGAGPGELCVTSAGKKCPVHASRRDLALGPGE